jgi:hemolysin III
VNPATTREFGLPTPGEEIANTISHGIGLALAIAATPILIAAALRGGSVWSLIGATVFAGAMFSLYFASTLYHALRHDKAKRFFRTLDHGAIFLLIAGTYTPFTLGVLRGPWGWTLLGLIWAMAAAGLTMKALAITRYRWLSMVLYLSMGWLVVIAAKPVLLRVPLHGILWLLAGGVAYTTGVAFYGAHRLRYHHFIWHLFVLAGTTCHFFAVLWYSA